MLLLAFSPLSAQQTVPVQAPVTPPESAFKQLSAANTLVGKRKGPFHMKLSFQIYSFEGQPAEQGTVEQWWSESDGSRLDITAPSFGTVHSTGTDALPNDQARRSLFLVGALLADVRTPVAHLNKALGGATPVDKKINGVPLHCTEAAEVAVCADDNQTIRYISEPNSVAIRNKSALFGGTKVALNDVLFLAGRRSISGDITTLQGFDPSTTAVKLSKPEVNSEAVDVPSKKIPGEVIAGKKISGSAPRYPMQARDRRISGTVILAATISKAGTIEVLFPVASPDASLTQAAIDAVKTWTYVPYLLNGSPTAVNTSITVDFNLNSSVSRF